MAAQDLTDARSGQRTRGGYVDNIVGPVAQVAERERVPHVASSRSMRSGRCSVETSGSSGSAGTGAVVDATMAVPSGPRLRRSRDPVFGDAGRDAACTAPEVTARGPRRRGFRGSFRASKRTSILFPFCRRASERRAASLMDGFADNLVLLRQVSGQAGFSGCGASGMEFPLSSRSSARSRRERSDRFGTRDVAPGQIRREAAPTNELHQGVQAFTGAATCTATRPRGRFCGAEKASRLRPSGTGRRSRRASPPTSCSRSSGCNSTSTESATLRSRHLPDSERTPRPSYPRDRAAGKRDRAEP